MPTWIQSLGYLALALFQIFVAVGIYFVPVIYRRRRRLVYTPLYFIVYLFTELKDDVIDEYFGSRDSAPLTQDEGEAKTLRNNTAILKTIASTALDTVILPACFAFIWLWPLSLNFIEFIIALVLLILIQLYRFQKSASTIDRYTIGKPRSRGWLQAFYILALVIIAVAMLRVQHWASPLLATRNYPQLFWEILDVIWSLVVVGILFSLVTAAITTFLLNRTIRQRNLSEQQLPTQSKQTSPQNAVSTSPKPGNQN